MKPFFTSAAHLVLLGFLLLTPFVADIETALAQTPVPAPNQYAPIDNSDYILLAPLPETYKTNTCTDITSPTQNCRTDFITYLQGIYKLAIGAGGALAVILFTIGGFQYMITDVAKTKEDGKKKMQNSILGLVLILTAYIVLYTINPDLLKLRFNPPQSPDEIFLLQVAELSGEAKTLNDQRYALLTERNRILAAQYNNELDRAAAEERLKQIDAELKINETKSDELIKKRVDLEVSTTLNELQKIGESIKNGSGANINKQCQLIRTYNQQQITLINRRPNVANASSTSYDNVNSNALNEAHYIRASSALRADFIRIQNELKSQGKWSSEQCNSVI